MPLRKSLYQNHLGGIQRPEKSVRTNRFETCSKCLSAFLVAACVGCGNSGPFEYVPVSGTVTYEDGSAIAAASIRLGFTALERGDDLSTRPRPGQAVVNVSDGSFSDATSYKRGDGLVPGKHKVVVIALDANGEFVDSVPKAYTRVRTTPLVIDTADVPLKIKVSKP